MYTALSSLEKKLSAWAVLELRPLALQTNGCTTELLHLTDSLLITNHKHYSHVTFSVFSRTFSRIMLSWIGYNESQCPTKSRTTCQILLVSGKHKLHRTFWVFVWDFSAFQHNNFEHFMCQYNQRFPELWLGHSWKNLWQMLHLMRVNVLLNHSSIFLST